jgi:hypothetical protein
VVPKVQYPSMHLSMKILLVHIKWKNLKIMILCQMMNHNKTPLWIMNKIMSLLGDTT